MISTNLQVRLNDPCGRVTGSAGWSRTRENSLALADAGIVAGLEGPRAGCRPATRNSPLLPGFCALMRPGGIYDAGHDEANPLGFTFIHFDAWTGRTFPEIESGATLQSLAGVFRSPRFGFL